MSLVERELPTLPEHLSSLPVFNGVRVTRSLVLCVCFVDGCLPFCTFSFGHCVVCSSSIYGFWLPLWYLQNLLVSLNKSVRNSFHFILSAKLNNYRYFTVKPLVLTKQGLVLCVMFCRSLFVPLFFFFWSLCCPSFFHLRILITSLVSSNSSCVLYHSLRNNICFLII